MRWLLWQRQKVTFLQLWQIKENPHKYACKWFNLISLKLSISASNSTLVSYFLPSYRIHFSVFLFSNINEIASGWNRGSQYLHSSFINGLSKLKRRSGPIAIVGRSVNSLSKDVVIMKRHHFRNDLEFFESMLKGKCWAELFIQHWVGCVVFRRKVS